MIKSVENRGQLPIEMGGCIEQTSKVIFVVIIVAIGVSMAVAGFVLTLFTGSFFPLMGMSMLGIGISMSTLNDNTGYFYAMLFMLLGLLLGEVGHFSASLLFPK